MGSLMMGEEVELPALEAEENEEETPTEKTGGQKEVE